MANAENLDREELIRGWRREETRSFSGWDFSHIEDRMREDPLPWSYVSRAAELLDRSRLAVDIGTGGGEVVLSLRDHWPETFVVTEEHPPNVALASRRLSPLGVLVVAARLNEVDPMPLAGAAFDLVLNRHSPLNPEDTARLLAPGGIVLSQQVHGRWLEDLMEVFGASPQWPFACLEQYAGRLRAAGLEIITEVDWTGNLTFDDVGAVVYLLTNTPWIVPGFSVDTHLEPLLLLQCRLEREEELRFTSRKYFLEARKAS